MQGRMSDTNRNLTAKTLLLLGELAKAMGPAFEGVGRPLLSTAVGNLSDSKSQVRGYVMSILCAKPVVNYCILCAVLSLTQQSQLYVHIIITTANINQCIVHLNSICGAPLSSRKCCKSCLQVRTAIVGMLDAWISAVPLEKVLPAVADAIAAPKASSEGKLTGLKWLSTVLDNRRASKGLAQALRAATLGMNDKASDVREAGTMVMTLVLEASLRDFCIQARCAVPQLFHANPKISVMKIWLSLTWLSLNCSESQSEQLSR